MFKEKNVYLFDGGFGTYYSQKYEESSNRCEVINLKNPQKVIDIHVEYINAGVDAIKTNTFGAFFENFGNDYEKIIKNGYNLALKAREISRRNVDIFADLGPVTGDEVVNQIEEYKKVVDVFLEEGATNFLFETLGDSSAVIEIAKYIRQRKKAATIVVSFGVMPDGYSLDGFFVKDLLEEVLNDVNIDAIGLNCISSAIHLNNLLLRLVNTYKFDITQKAFLFMPNAGYPVVRGYRTFFEGNIDFFEKQIEYALGLGVSIVGGCCGTTPKYIKKIKDGINNFKKNTDTDQNLDGKERKCLDENVNHNAELNLNKINEIKSEIKELLFSDDNIKADGIETNNNKLKTISDNISKTGKIFAVELDSPKNDDTSTFMKNAKKLQEAGVDKITIADCPIARPRMDSSLLACKVKRELGLDVIPHMTCRDRNINATKALLLGLSAEKIRNVLVITGDPIPSAQRDEVKSVYQFNSRKLARYINSLNQELLNGKINIYGALNVNAVNFNVELDRALQKMEEGVCGFLTQPILTHRGFDNLKIATEKLKGALILGGIIPVVSERNARFMQSEINGIDVDDEIIERYVGKTKEEARVIAVELSVEIASKIKDYVDGYYLMTPFNRTDIIIDVIKRIKEL
ncbi:bifunctional homocysteine S-methyltransferase/methylenetetrahydrofolate reductase [Lachnobacterium bovis]|uniref:bifunctional homocysteine S-methyltransferase/methylenetetrahydrofolate reductase n=1 Tax=Lachnobacterium bovis TaxID=140626 RepID=UPI00047FA47D|nr:bifunctional homocysteine S-methyltransferase/methylenetetrahydrofolate reductase [Lachnobacterium bovis]